MKLKVISKDGKDAGELNVSFSVIDNAKGTQAVHEAVVAFRAAQRLGTAKVKMRDEVSGSGKKPWRQKGTGRARAGSVRSPLWRGGGITHGPRQRDYTKKVTHKSAHLALRKAFSARLHDNDVVVVDNLDLDSHKTKGLLQLLDQLAIAPGATVLLVDTQDKLKDATAKLRLAAGNLLLVDVTAGRLLNTYQVLRYDKLIIAQAAFAEVEQRLIGGK
ncbi:MAG: 50S ribosomal protein L4 [Pedosphaera sp.]|nr:50S ribosomal protein L4 [Pedosphaera sp.]MSU42758.1 50S ribosomal protein L4 [Pedosphaera sp.]